MKIFFSRLHAGLQKASPAHVPTTLKMIKNKEESGKGFFLPSARRAGPESPASAFPRHTLYDRPSRRFSRHRMFLPPFFPRGLPSPAIIHPLLCLDLSDRKRPSRTTGKNGILSCLAPAAPRKRVRKTRSDGHENDRFSQFLSLSKLRIARSAPVSDALPITAAKHPLPRLAPGNWLCLPSARSASLPVTSVPSSTYTQIGRVDVLWPCWLGNVCVLCCSCLSVSRVPHDLTLQPGFNAPHRTGRADCPHPALRPVSHDGDSSYHLPMPWAPSLPTDP